MLNKAETLLKEGFLPADNRNIEKFKGIIRDYLLVACFTFSCGVAVSFPLAKVVCATSMEQAKRTPIINKLK